MIEVEFRKSKNKKKKYDVILPNGNIVSFGSINHQQYFDSTPLKLYSHLDHKDEKRKQAFQSRFGKLYQKNKFNIESPIFWSYNYLWS